MDKSTKQLGIKIIKHYGVEHQIDKLAEEHAELQHALRNKDIEHITEEIADVLCLIEQIADEMKVDWMKVRETVNEKVERETKRIESGNLAGHNIIAIKQMNSKDGAIMRDTIWHIKKECKSIYYIDELIENGRIVTITEKQLNKYFEVI